MNKQELLAKLQTLATNNANEHEADTAWRLIRKLQTQHATITNDRLAIEFAEPLYICKSKDGRDYIQGGRLVFDGHMTTWGQWGTKRGALKQTKQWWIDNVQPHSLSYCDLILVSDPKQLAAKLPPLLQE